jgi:O-antigen ligase
MKWLVLLFSIAAVPLITAWIRAYPHTAPTVWMFFGLAPFALTFPQFKMAIITEDYWLGFVWPGFVHGIEVTGVDFLALAIYLALPRAGPSAPFRLSMAFYFMTVLLSAFQARYPMTVIFYLWQLARMFLVYAVVAKASAEARFLPALLNGMAVGLCLEACLVIWQKFGLGMLQPPGTFVSQNLLGVISHFVVFPFAALLLAGHRRWSSAAAPIAGAIIAALGGSRATIGLAVIGYAALFILSGLPRWTPRKALIGLIGVIVIAALAPIAISTINQRFVTVSTVGVDERAQFISAAADILAKNPMGIGANNFGFIANTEGYMTRAGIVQQQVDVYPIVHNIYWLTVAETGYLGLFAFVLLLVRPLLVAFRCGWRNQRISQGELLLGLGTALLVVYIHSYFEWIYFTYQAQYFFAMEVGMVAGLAQQLGYWRLTNNPNKRRFGSTIARRSFKNESM